MLRAVADFDWKSTPLGPRLRWPHSRGAIASLVLASAQPMFLAWGRDRTLLYNDAFAPLLGARHPAALGAPLLEAWPAARAVIEPLLGRLACGLAVQLDDIALTVDRQGAVQEAHVAACITPLNDESGKVAGLFCVCFETTDAVLARRDGDRDRKRLARMVDQEQQKTVQALADMNDTLEHLVDERARAARLAEARFRGIFDSTSQIVCLIGLDGVIVEVNRAGLLAVTAQRAEMLGLPLWETPWFSASPEAVTTLRTRFPAVRAGDTLRTELALLLPASGVRRFDFSLSPVRDDRGAIAFVVAEGRDITDQKLLEDQLRQSQKMEAVGQLTGGLAHDFNNLLTGVTGGLELLQTRVAQGRVQDLDRYIAAAQGAARRAAALTHRLLAFSRQQTLDPKPIDLNRLVADMEDLVRRTVGPAVVTDVVGAAGLWTTLVDPNQMENALLNLCINARDAMPDGGRLTIETANKWLDDRAARDRDLPAGQYVTLCVSDTGTGMTPEVIRRAFDPFYTTKPLGMGTGLGLSMIYGFVRQSGGQARIYSEPGQGTLVCLYLPRHFGPADRLETPPPVALTRSQSGETVLVVDDEPTVRMLIAEVLGDLGYVAAEAPDGAAGLHLLRTDHPVDLLITDVGLPGGINGRQLADAARTIRPGLKVLFITGYAENAVVGHGHLPPGMHVLTKPFAMQTLATRIKDLISGCG
jgi:PAS domain S-box-containing protein